MSELRRVGGEMVPHRKPAGRRVLLQYEADLCNAVGITEEEYWFFVDQATAYNGQRAKEYDLVPDVQNNPVAIVVSLVIGVALTYISTLLAPKPKQPAEQKRIKTEDATGISRFARSDSFNSIQELATIGSTIPLVFAASGVRVSSQLLWSQLISRKNYQELRAVLLFSYGELASKPDFEGFAIGDTLIKNFPKGKLSLYFSEGLTGSNRIVETGGQRYPEGKLRKFDQHNEDVMSLWWHEDNAWKEYFSGTRTPGTQVEFGVFSPIPNHSMYKVNYELVLIQENLKGDSRRSAEEKRRKMYHGFSTRAGIIQISGGGTNLSYQLNGEEEAVGGFPFNKVEDVKQSVERRRIDADETLSVGEQYLYDGCVYICTKQDRDDIWRAGGPGQRYTLVHDETIHGNKPGDFFDREAVHRQQQPWDTVIPMRVAIGAVTNNRDCEATEIGIKSTVWRRINGFSNVNSQPTDSVIAQFERDNGSIQLGSMSKYVRRVSFFKLYAREIKSNTWRDITVDASGRATFFCISGQSTREMYNSIRIYTPQRGQFEYRLVPFGGNFVRRHLGTANPAIMLTGYNGQAQKEQYNATTNGYRYFCYGREQTLTDVFVNNFEWFVGSAPRAVIGQVSQTDRHVWGTIPGSMQWVTQETRFDAFTRGGRGFSYGGRNYIVVTEATVGNRYNRRRVENVTKIWDGHERGDSSTERYVRGDLRIDTGYRNHKFYEIRRQERRFIDAAPNFQGELNPTRLSGIGTDFRIFVRYWAAGNVVHFTIRNQGSNYSVGDRLRITIPGYGYSVDFSITQVGRVDNLDRLLVQNNAIADYFLYDAESSSHQDGPEHAIAYVNEFQEVDNFNYDDLAVAGIRLNSGKEWSSFSEVSAYIKQGIKIPRLSIDASDNAVVGAEAASNNFAEIAYALLTNSSFGAGETIGSNQVSEKDMAIAAEYCRANGFAWDGLVAEKQNLREFIFVNAGYNLLDFTIKGGRFGLFPSYPYNSDYKINTDAKPAIKALFTDGNMRNMKVSFLTPEERQMFKATVVYKEDVVNGFGQKRSVTLALGETETTTEEIEALPEESFDMSGFCKSREHARTFAKQALLVRRHVDHGLRFETTPQAAMALEPGEYFRVVSEATHTSRFQTGSIGPTGTIVSKDGLADGSYSVYFWKPGTTVVNSTTLTVSNGQAVGAALRGTVFSIKNSTTEDRVYKVETLQYAEDGLVEISGSFVPLRDDGKFQVLDWDESNFVNL